MLRTGRSTAAMKPGHKGYQLRRVVLLSVACCSLGFAQVVSPASAPADQPYQFSTSVKMVVLQTTVLNNKGSFVRGLRRSSFAVYEDARKQTIKLFTHNDSPVAIGLVVDNSGSMRRKHAAVLAAAKAFARASNQRDELFIINFNDQVKLGLPNKQLFSAKARELERALPPTAGGGKTALYDALEMALTHIHELKQDRKALILISDGGDNASSHTLEQVVSDATNSDVVIYTIGIFGKDVEETNPAFMKQIALVTGGEAFLPARATQAASNTKKIARTIRNEYTLGYSPDTEGAPGQFRAIRVSVKSSRRRETLVARTRSGYTPQLAQAAGVASGK